MMDNRVAAIKDILHKNGFGGKVSVVFVFTSKALSVSGNLVA